MPRRREGYAFIVHFLSSLHKVDGVVSESLEIAYGMKYLRDPERVGVGKLFRRELHKICAKLVLIFVKRVFA